MKALPPFGTRVPQGGSDCAKCEYVSADRRACSNERFRAWHGSGTLPAPADEYCCNAFETKAAPRTTQPPRSLGATLQRQKEKKR